MEQKLYFMTPAYCVRITESWLRKKSAHELTLSLGDICNQYWEAYNNMNDSDLGVQKQIQSWYWFQAYRKILSDYGWWHWEKYYPINWNEGDEYDT